MAILWHIANLHAALADDAAAGGWKKSCQQTEQRGFSAAVWSGQDDEIMVFDLIEYVTKHMAFAITQTNVFYVKEKFIHRRGMRVGTIPI